MMKARAEGLPPNDPCVSDPVNRKPLTRVVNVPCLVIANLPDMITVPDGELPAPIRLIPDSETVVQLQFPAGTTTVSPGEAAFTVFWTSVCEQDGALMVLACALKAKT